MIVCWRMLVHLNRSAPIFRAFFIRVFLRFLLPVVAFQVPVLNNSVRYFKYWQPRQYFEVNRALLYVFKILLTCYNCFMFIKHALERLFTVKIMCLCIFCSYFAQIEAVLESLNRVFKRWHFELVNHFAGRNGGCSSTTVSFNRSRLLGRQLGE